MSNSRHFYSRIDLRVSEATNQVTKPPLVAAAEMTAGSPPVRDTAPVATPSSDSTPALIPFLAAHSTQASVMASDSTPTAEHTADR